MSQQFRILPFIDGKIEVPARRESTVQGMSSKARHLTEGEIVSPRSRKSRRVNMTGFLTFFPAWPTLALAIPRTCKFKIINLMLEKYLLFL